MFEKIDGSSDEKIHTLCRGKFPSTRLFGPAWRDEMPLSGRENKGRSECWSKSPDEA